MIAGVLLPHYRAPPDSARWPSPIPQSMDTVYLRQSTQHVKETKMGFARKQSIAFLVVLLVVAAVEIPGASAKDKDPGSHLVPR